MNDKQAEKIVRDVWPFEFKPTDRRVQAVMAVARMESYYGFPRQKEFHGHNNWGAMHSNDPNCSSGFWYKDSHLIDGKWVEYKQCFQSFPTPEKGAKAFLSLLNRMPHVRKWLSDGNDSILTLALEMRRDNYHCARLGPDGRCSSATEAQKRADAKHYAKALWPNVQKIVQNTDMQLQLHYSSNDSDSSLVIPIMAIGIGALIMKGRK